jgi:hypothetical protein
MSVPRSAPTANRETRIPSSILRPGELGASLGQIRVLSIGTTHTAKLTGKPMQLDGNVIGNSVVHSSTLIQQIHETTFCAGTGVSFGPGSWPCQGRQPPEAVADGQRLRQLLGLDQVRKGRLAGLRSGTDSSSCCSVAAQEAHS